MKKKFQEHEQRTRDVDVKKNLVINSVKSYMCLQHTVIAVS